MDEPKLEFITAPEGVARRLSELANQLQSIVEDENSPMAWRRQSRRYGPFLSRMAAVPSLCEALAAVELDEDTPKYELQIRLGRFLLEFQLPYQHGFVLYEWLELLFAARQPYDDARVMPPFRDEIEGLAVERWEVQFVFPVLTLSPVEGPLVTDIFQIAQGGAETRTEASARVRPILVEALRRFMPGAKRRKRRHRLWDRRFSVRLLQTSMRREERPHPDDANPVANVLVLGQSRSSEVVVIDSFEIEWRERQRLESIADKVLQELLVSFDGVTSWIPASGRPPEPDQLVRWWEATVIGHLTPFEIAVQDHPAGPDVAEELAESIRRRLYEVGIRPVRELPPRSAS